MIADQYSGYYEVDRKSNKWWRRCVQKLQVQAASNAWIIYKEKFHKRGLPFKKFLGDLSYQLIKAGSSETMGPLRRIFNAQARHDLPITSPEFFALLHHHPFPAPSKTRANCVVCKRGKTSFICYTCRVRICNKHRCFFKYHEDLKRKSAAAAQPRLGEPENRSSLLSLQDISNVPASQNACTCHHGDDSRSRSLPISLQSNNIASRKRGRPRKEGLDSMEGATKRGKENTVVASRRSDSPPTPQASGRSQSPTIQFAPGRSSTPLLTTIYSRPSSHILNSTFSLSFDE